MNLSNKIVNSLWVGGELSPLELLTLRSFVNQGHEFRLWAYEPLQGLPEGVVTCPADSIIPKEQVFRYRDDGHIDWGKGSYAGFSDIFRFKLLHQVGGWWVDMDVTCLRPFDVETDYFFRNHWLFPVVGNVMKVPRACPLMLECYEAALVNVTADNTDWHLPLRILNQSIISHGLSDFRRTGLFNLDTMHEIEPYRQRVLPIPNDWYGIHWIKSGWHDDWRPGSTFDRLLNEHGIITDRWTQQGKWILGRLRSVLP